MLGALADCDITYPVVLFWEAHHSGQWRPPTGWTVRL